MGDELDITIYMSAVETRPYPLRVTWGEFAELLLGCSLQTWRADDAEKKRRSAFTLAKVNGSRSNANVVHLSGVCADVDIAPDDPRYVPLPAMVERLRSMGVAAIIYTTTKSTAAAHRYRVVMRFPEAVAPDRYRAAWQAVNAELGGIMDRSTHDPSRLMFTPARWQGKEDAYHAFEVVEGGAILSRDELAAMAGGVFPVTVDGSVFARKPSRTTISAATPDPLSADELAILAHGKADDWSGWAILGDLARTPLVSSWARHELPADIDQRGSRNYRFCKSVVRTAQVKGYPVNMAIVSRLLERWFGQYRDGESLNPDNIEPTSRHALAWCYRNPPAEKWDDPSRPDGGASI